MAIIFNAILMFNLQPSVGQPRDAALGATSSYSPVFDMLGLGPIIKRISVTVYPSEKKLSIARQFPNPDADSIEEENLEIYINYCTDILFQHITRGKRVKT